MNTPASAAVLVVEDDPKIARLLTDQLPASGLAAHAIDNGLVAVAEIRRARPVTGISGDHFGVRTGAPIPPRGTSDTCRVSVHDPGGTDAALFFAVRTRRWQDAWHGASWGELCAPVTRWLPTLNPHLNHTIREHGRPGMPIIRR